MNFPHLFVGVDISKLKHDVAIMNKSKKLVSKQLVIQDSFDGYQYFSNNLKKFIAYFGMNSTVNVRKIKTKKLSPEKGNPIVRHKLFMATMYILSKQIEPFFS
jgi:transposase